MDAFRRIRLRSASDRNAARQISADRTGEPSPQLHGASRRLAEALEQLRDGVPLNWGQIEDDPQLATLARLQEAGQECRLTPLREPSSALKATLFHQLSATLPAPKPKQEKVMPKSLAGFSENVPVLTQVEDDIRLTTDIPALLIKAALVLVIIGLAIWGIVSLLGALSTPTYAWIEVRRGNDLLNHQQRTAGSQAQPCLASSRSTNPAQPLTFLPARNLREAQADVDFHIPTLPSTITTPTTYTFDLILAEVSPCQDSLLKPSDVGAIVKLQYASDHVVEDPTARPNASGRPTGIKHLSSQLALFVANRQPAPLDVSVAGSSWKEVRVGELHGVYWQGGTYQDRAGTQWVGGISVLMIERGDTVVTMIGSYNEGETEDMLLEVARNIRW